MSQAEVAPFGTWRSPITAALIAKKATSVHDVLVDLVSATIYHIESRPSEDGRDVIVETKEGCDVFGPGWNARSGVQEYGGAAATVYGGAIYFSNFSDGRVYKTDGGAEPVAVTPGNKNHRFADFAVHPTCASLVVSILEDHTKPAPSDVVTTLVVIDTIAGTVNTLLCGADFYSTPCFNPSGSKMAWKQWNHPDMPWEGSEVFVASIQVRDSTIAIGSPIKIAGEKSKISAAEPQWMDDDLLLFTCDVSEYSNPWICDTATGGEQTYSQPIMPSGHPEDFGQPAWTLGNSSFVALDKKTALFTTFRGGRNILYLANIRQRELTELDSPYVDIQNIRKLSSSEVIFLGKTTDEPLAIVLLSFDALHKPSFVTLKSAEQDHDDDENITEDFISQPQSIVLSLAPNNDPLHATFYPPRNPAFRGPKGEKPPSVINVHGGPTSKGSLGLNMGKQFFTSRGFAWVDVEYGGSSGYGRKYIERLAGAWGISDVNDCIEAVRQLSAAPHELIDPNRAVIRGGSAGGFTVLASMCAASGVFAAGTSSYGISDLRKLSEFTHKFESRYADKLLGGTPEEVPEVYLARSPVFHADKITSPLLILQGSIDAVVPPEQAQLIIGTIGKIGGYVEYHVFEGEGHGWRKAENIQFAFEKELDFYLRMLKLVS